MTDWKERAERAEAELARLRAQEPVAHMYPSDLERFQTNETFATAYSVAVGCPDEHSEPLYRAAPPAQPMQEPVAPPGWREALQFYADGSHFVIADEEAWDTVSGEPSNFWCDDGTATVEDGTVAKMALAGMPLSDEDDDGAAPPAQPAEPVQRLSDERAAFEAWHNEYRTQELVRRDDTYYNTHVRCRWEGWQARAIESALQPGWRDIESAPKDGTRIILGSSDGAWMAEYQPVYQSGYRPDNPWFSVMLNHAHMGRFPKAKPTHWQPIPPAPKATK